MACVNLPSFPLQLLIKQNPEWRDYPVAVVDKDKPQGVILWVNRAAVRSRVLTGMRYAKGLSLAPELRAGVVTPADIQGHITLLIEQLRFFTPHIEPNKKEPGVFSLDASGLSLLHESLNKWAGLIGADLSRADYHWSATVGFTRYGTYATAKTTKGITVFDTMEDERHHACATSIVRLNFDPKLRDGLSQLGITTVGGFLELPANEIHKRFGPEAEALYKLAKNELYTPIEGVPLKDRFESSVIFDHPEKQIERLLHVIEQSLDSLVASLEQKSKLLAAVRLSFKLDNGEEHTEILKPAHPTLDIKQVLNLIDLRLQTISLKSGVTDLEISITDILANQKQLNLFRKKSQRDLNAVERAFAKIRAEFGNDAVMRAKIREGHLPEACFEWEPMKKLKTAAPRRVKLRRLARRFFTKSVVLETPAFLNKNGRLNKSHVAQNSDDIIGPFIISGGWWKRRTRRDYYYIRKPDGQWLWIYYDRHRKRSFLQGAVE